MVVQYHYIDLIPDNDASYFSLLRGVIDGIDPASSMSITKGSNGYIFRLLPSATIHIDSLIRQLTDMNTLMGIQLEFAKSSKVSTVIHWKININ